MIMGSKSRGLYTTGGYCGKRKGCANDGKGCDKCVKYSNYKKSLPSKQG